MDRIVSMDVFRRTARLSSFTAAARELGISASMATKHILFLEEMLGVRLFNRTTRQVTLTESGAIYLSGVDLILGEVDALDQLMSAQSDVVRGELRISAPVSFGAKQIVPLITEFQLLHPDVKVELDLNDRVVNLVEEGWDMAIRIGRLAPSSMVARRLAPCRTLLCASPRYLAGISRPVSPEDLSGHQCLCYTLAREGSGIWSFGTDGTLAVRVEGSLRSNNGSAIVEAAIAGLGFIYQPSFMVSEAIAAGKLEPVELDIPSVELSINAVFPSRERLPAKTRAFLDHIAHRFTETPPWDRAIAEARNSASAIES